MPEDERTPSAPAIALLRRGTVKVDGRLPWSSNYTFLVDVVDGDAESKAIYKPLDGEQPLHDFPEGLYKREVAAYEMSVALGWPNVPETIVRDDAPFGVGSLQRFQSSDFQEHYFTLFERAELQPALRDIALFDVLVNNADRKSGHCLWGEDGLVYAIDNGLSFHTDPKLRTVIWEFAGETISEEALADIERVRNGIPRALVGLLRPEEMTSLVERMDETLRNPVFPPLDSQRQYPWPLI